MATLTLTNPGATPVYIGDLYLEIPPGQSRTVTRRTSELALMPSLHAAKADGRVLVSIQLTDDEKAALSFFVDAPNMRRSITLTMEDFFLGVNAPVPVTLGTTPTIHALRYSATIEKASTHMFLPWDLDPNNRIGLHMEFALIDVQSPGDSLDVTVDYIIMAPETPGAGPGKANTTLLVSEEVTVEKGANPLDIYRLTTFIEPDDATNPFWLDRRMNIALELHLTNTTGVARADLISTCLCYAPKQALL